MQLGPGKGRWGSGASGRGASRGAWGAGCRGGCRADCGSPPPSARVPAGHPVRDTGARGAVASKMWKTFFCAHSTWHLHRITAWAAVQTSCRRGARAHPGCLWPPGPLVPPEEAPLLFRGQPGGPGLWGRSVPGRPGRGAGGRLCPASRGAFPTAVLSSLATQSRGSWDWRPGTVWGGRAQGPRRPGRCGAPGGSQEGHRWGLLSGTFGPWHCPARAFPGHTFPESSHRKELNLVGPRGRASVLGPGALCADFFPFSPYKLLGGSVRDARVLPGARPRSVGTCHGFLGCF